MSLISFSGLASGIDSTALIEAILGQERSARISPFERELEEKTNTNSAFEELKGLLEDLSSASQGFRSLSGGAVSREATSSNELVISATASNAAAAGSYDVTVDQLATNATFSFNDRFLSDTSVINSEIVDGFPEADRTVSYTVGQGDSAENIDVVLTSTTTLSDFANDFNTQSENATASIINVGTSDAPSYALSIQSKNQGEQEGTITLNSVGSNITSAGFGAFQTSSLNQAKNLELSLEGIAGTISRSSNTVSDLITGLSFTASSTGTSTINISNDTQGTEEKLGELVDAYNTVVKFISENDAITEAEAGAEITNVFGPLASTSIDDNLLTALRSAITQSGTSGGSVNIFADLGISTARDGTLDFNVDTFQEAITNDPSAVSLILTNFADTIGGVDGTIAQYTRFNGLIDQTVGGNDNRISELQGRIRTIEESLSKKESSLTSQFARLESDVSRLQSQQAALTSLLP